MAERTSIQLSVPAQRLEALSFCEPGLDSFAGWLSNLPMADISSSAKQLFHALSEVDQLKCGIEDRFNMLEMLRGPTHFACLALARKFLNQPVLVNEKIRRSAARCQALQNQLAIGYKVTVVQAIQERIPFGGDVDPNSPGGVVPIAIYRATTEYTESLLRSYQLYTDPAPRIWLELNQLYYLSERRGMQDISHTEFADNEELGPFTIKEAYQRALLLACVSPNQLRQRQLSVIYDGLAEWCRHCDLSTEPGRFVVDLTQDSAPHFEPLPDDIPWSDSCRALETTRLTAYLDKDLEEPDSVLYRPQGLSQDLIDHAITVWGSRTARIFKRSESTGQVEVCVGFGAAHYWIADRVSFNTLMHRDHALLEIESNPFLDALEPMTPTAQRSSVDQRRDNHVPIPLNHNIRDPDRILHERSITDDEPDLAPEYPTHQTQIVDTSPGGYCVRWPSGAPANLQTGELLAIRENVNQRWAIAVVRWMRQTKDEGTLSGMELLAPVALPIGAQMINTKNADKRRDFARALMLPALPSLKQPAMLVTPRIPFTEHHKILIHQGGLEVKAQLTTLKSATDLFAVFHFRLLEQVDMDLGTDTAAQEEEEVELTNVSLIADLDDLWADD